MFEHHESISENNLWIIDELKFTYLEHEKVEKTKMLSNK